LEEEIPGETSDQCEEFGLTDRCKIICISRINLIFIFIINQMAEAKAMLQSNIVHILENKPAKNIEGFR